MHSVALLVCGLAFLAWGASAEHPEPQVFHNRTRDAFLTKVHERRGNTPGPGPGPGNLTQLGACVRERNSSAPIQSAVEDLAAKCTQLLNDGSNWRPLSGMCLGQEGGRAKVEVTCAPVSPTTKGILPVVKTFQCDAEEPCVTVRGPDSADTVAKFAPSPGDRGRLVKVETVERVGTAIQYIGSWYSGNAEEAFNLFAQVSGPSKVHFDYGGGTGARAMQAHSFGFTWSCSGCPGGLLKITAYYSTSAAVLAKPAPYRPPRGQVEGEGEEPGDA